MKLLLPILLISLLFLDFSLMIKHHNKIIEYNIKYIQEHHCKVISTEPEHPVGMMIQGETNTYKCDNGIFNP